MPEVDDDSLDYDAFATDQLWKPSNFFQDPTAYESTLFAPLNLDVPSITLDHPYAPKTTLERELRLPDLESFEFGPLPELESLDQSSISLDTPSLEEEDDIWQVAYDLGPANKDVNFFSWELFEDAKHVDRQTTYVTESGPEALDAALAHDEDKTPAGRVVRGHVLLDSLWNLGLGRSSILFTWDGKARTFVPAIQDGRASGLTLPSAKSLTNWFIMIGNTLLYLRSFVERTFASASSIPARVALATSISSTLSTFEDYLGRHANSIKSLLQLQELFQKPREIMMHIARLVDAAKHARTNEQLCSILYQRLLELEEGDGHLRRLSTEILCRVSQPTLDIVGEWIGIQGSQATAPIVDRAGFVELEEGAEEQVQSEYIFRPEAMPRFVDDEDGKAIFDIGNSLRFIESHHPDHPMASLKKADIQPPHLDWKFDWQDIDSISARAKAYEESLRKAVLDYVKDGSDQTHDESVDADADVDALASPCAATADSLEFGGELLLESISLLDKAPGEYTDALPDELREMIAHFLSREKEGATQLFSPPISLTSSLSFRPLLSAQAKLVNATTLRLFFRSHQLRMHLSLQRQYHLLGDGVFSSRLASALFDPERESAERHKGTMRSGVQMGLQLGSRSTWPPASSELRLALMGVLSESFYSSALYRANVKSHGISSFQRDRDELPGQLNFSIRQISEAEMEMIMDPDSLYALDFLRLQYVPPSPLNLVISNSALEKYDSIFRFLLRILRMCFVVSRLPRLYPDASSRSFRMEAHHFVTAMSIYIFQTGIAEHWTAFENHTSTIETRLAEEDAAGELGTRVTSGLDSLKDTHEQCLDSIMFSLLLRRRQKKIMSLLEEIFGLMLLFSKSQREGSDVQQSSAKMYTSLRAKIKIFISVCRGLTGKKGYGKGRGTSEENTIERLVLLLEMNGYYAG